MTWELKNGVSMQGLNIVMRKALIICHKEYSKSGVTMVITSTTEGRHSIGSLHYYGYAFDLRTNSAPRDVMQLIFNRIKERFKGTDYQVVMERDHLHVEYDKASEL